MTAIALFRRPANHSTAKLAIGLAVDLVCRVADRRNVVKAAQFALNCARLDVGCAMSTDGEAALQGWALDLIPEGRRIHVVDVGAAVGEWSRSLLETAEGRGRMDEIDLHAFEPYGSTFERLADALGNRDVSLQRLAVSDQPGDATLHIERPGGRWNSLHEIPSWHTRSHSTHESVVKTTLDDYARQADLDRIDILKVDTEGHDLAVLNGASGLFRRRCIGVAQFEYNPCWIYARHFLRDAFDLLTPLGYRLGKLTPRGVMFCPNWDQQLETFVQAQYVACPKDMAERLPRVECWHLSERRSEHVAGIRYRSWGESPIRCEDGGHCRT